MVDQTEHYQPLCNCWYLLCSLSQGICYMVPCMSPVGTWKRSQVCSPCFRLSKQVYGKAGTEPCLQIQLNAKWKQHVSFTMFLRETHSFHFDNFYKYIQNRHFISLFFFFFFTKPSQTLFLMCICFLMACPKILYSEEWDRWTHRLKVRWMN